MMVKLLTALLLLAISSRSAADTGNYDFSFNNKDRNDNNNIKNRVSELIKQSNSKVLPTEIKASSKIGQSILSKAQPAPENNKRQLENNNYYDNSFVSEYSIKFQGCHHVSQWNNAYDEQNDVHIMTKRLVRFRLCPSQQCSSQSGSGGCSSKYGDYVVDMNTYVSAYMDGLENQFDQICYDVKTVCSSECGDNSEDDCMSDCYDSYDLSKCLNYNGEGGGDDDGDDGDDFDPAEYAECAEFDFRRKARKNKNRFLEQNNNDGYYIGPYCADQGGEIHFGLFSDDSCTTFLQDGLSTFYNAMGYDLPHSDTSLVTDLCLQCAENDGNRRRRLEDDQAEINEMCETIYQVSGKCETKMNIDYPNESACTYIEGIKILKTDGVIRTQETKKSKAAAIFIGLFLTLAVLLMGYVMYLRTKLGRAKINLSAAAGASGLS